jgi:phage recombination protein Bet
MNAQTPPDASTAIALRPPSMPMPPQIGAEFGLSEGDWRVLVDQTFPSAKSAEAVAMALAYCRARKLDVFKRPVHIVPMWSSALKKEVETVWPGIAEIRTTAARTREYAGIDAVEYGPMTERTFIGERDKWENRQKVGTEKFSKTVRFPEWASVVVYRNIGGVRCAFHAKVFWEETYASIGKSEVPNEMWAKRPRGQLDKCVEAAAIRKAFPEELGNTYAAEEMEGCTIDHEVRVVAPASPPSPLSPPSPPPAKIAASTQKPVEIDGDLVDGETGGVAETAAPAPPPAPKVASAAPTADEFPDPEKVLADAEGQFAAAQDEATWEEVRTEFAHYLEALFPPDADRLLAIMQRSHERVTTPAEVRQALRDHPVNAG